jgi:hypothetical protein
MPVHEFVHEATGQTVEVYVPINADQKDHQVQVVDGKEFKRIYAAPLASIDTRPGDATKEDFTRLTTNKKGLTVGQMWEMSAEMSEHRAAKAGGRDEVKESFYKNYKKEFGKPHPDDQRRERMAAANAKLKEMGIRVEV